MKTLTIVDLVLHAATICHLCRTHGRPTEENDQEHGQQFFHTLSPSNQEQCRANQIWSLIRKLEAAK